MIHGKASREAWLVAGAWGFFSASVLALRSWAPAFAAWSPGCLFHHATGLPCFTCGATRAALRLAAGDPLGALLWNPLAALALAAAWVGGFVAPVWLALGLPVPGIPTVLSVPVRIALAGILLANWCFLVFRGV
jgi:Protein of unknown function (DUF2752)